MANTLQITEKHIDTLSGEIISDKTKTVDTRRIPDEPSYIKFYIDDLSLLNRLTAGETRILLYIAANASYQG